MSPTLYMNDDENLALVKAKDKTGREVWVVLSKETTKIVYGPDKFLSSAKLYLKIMDREQTYDVQKKSS